MCSHAESTLRPVFRIKTDGPSIQAIGSIPNTLACTTPTIDRAGCTHPQGGCCIQGRHALGQTSEQCSSSPPARRSSRAARGTGAAARG